MGAILVKRADVSAWHCATLMEWYSVTGGRAMNKLLILDWKDYTEDMPLLERHGVRAIILRNGLLAVQRGRKGELKLPGGGIDPGESHLQTLLREVREELGLLVKKGSETALGEVTEMREDLLKPGRKFVCHTYYYFCEVEERRVPVCPTQSELTIGFKPSWEPP